jgi:hypothetical protein
MDNYIRLVIFYTALKPGNLMLCECNDGSVRVFQDDTAIPGHEWHTRDIAKAIVAYQEMKLTLVDERRRGKISN